MTIGDRWRRWCASPLGQHCLHALGWLLIVASAAVAPLPGPGGVPVFAAGAALVLKTSPRARRWYARRKRRWPKTGAWIDWALRRPSERRRRERDRAMATAAGD